MLTNNKNKKCCGFSKKNSWIFKIFKNRILMGGKFLKILSFINLPWAYVMSQKKFGPDRFSRFDVYWIQTNKQTDTMTSQIYIYIYMNVLFYYKHYIRFKQKKGLNRQFRKFKGCCILLQHVI